MSTLAFVLGVGHWVYANLGSFRTFANAVRAAGTETGALQAALVSRHGIPSLSAFVTGTSLLAPPLPRLQWYGALAGVVVVTVLAFGVYRAVWAERPYKWVTMNETVGVGVAAAVASALYGGPILAGAVLMPFVFLVVIRHTRMAYTYKPNYAYVVGVSAPLAVIGAEYVVQTPPLAAELVAVALPVLSALVLLFNAFVRPKLFG